MDLNKIKCTKQNAHGRIRQVTLHSHSYHRHYFDLSSFFLPFILLFSLPFFGALLLFFAIHRVLRDSRPLTPTSSLSALAAKLIATIFRVNSHYNINIYLIVL